MTSRALLSPRGFAVAICFLFATVAAAPAADSFEVGPWQGGSLYFEDGSSLGCNLERAYGNSRLVLTLGVTGELMVMVIDAALAGIDVPDVPARLTIDGLLDLSLPGSIGAGGGQVYVRDGAQFLDAFTQGSALVMTIADKSWSFALDGSSAAVARVQQCLAAESPAAAAGGTLHGAIAYSVATDAIGTSWNYATAAEAETVALTQCAQDPGAHDCTVVVSFANACGAFTASPEGAWGAEQAATVAEAEALALATCAARGGTGCIVVDSFCAK